MPQYHIPFVIIRKRVDQCPDEFHQALAERVIDLLATSAHDKSQAWTCSALTYSLMLKLVTSRFFHDASRWMKSVSVNLSALLRRNVQGNLELR